MRDVPKVPFGDLLESSQNGLSKRRGDGDPVRVLRLADIVDGQIDESDPREINLSSKEIEKYQLQRGDLVCVRVNGSPSLVGRLVPFQSASRWAYCDHFIRFRPKADVVDTRYLNHYFSTQIVRRHVELNMVSSAGQNTVSQGTMLGIPVPLPALDEQRRIVAEIDKQFSRLDEAVANLQRVKANLKRYKAAVLKAAVDGRLVETEASLARREGRKYETGELLLKQILEARRVRPKGKSKYKEPLAAGGSPSLLPEGWSFASVGQIADIGSGNTPAGVLEAVRISGDVPWFKVGDMNHERNLISMQHATAWLSTGDVDRLGLRTFPEQTVLFPKRGGAIATNKKRRLERDGCADLNVMGLTPDASVAAYFFAWFEGIDLAKLSDGSNIPQINNKDIEPLCVPLPPAAEQVRIVAEVDLRLSILRGVESDVDANLLRAAALHQSILSRAFGTS